MSAKTIHTFAMELTPNGRSSCVLLDGLDISSLLAGVIIEASVHHGTQIQLIPGKGHRAEIILTLPEAHIIIGEEQ